MCAIIVVPYSKSMLFEPSNSETLYKLIMQTFGYLDGFLVFMRNKENFLNREWNPEIEGVTEEDKISFALLIIVKQGYFKLGILIGTQENTGKLWLLNVSGFEEENLQILADQLEESVTNL